MNVVVAAERRAPVRRWYCDYFDADFWLLAEREHGAECAHEAGELTRIAEDGAPGRRIVDVGCGVGTRAIALARAGFDVVGLDVSAWALEVARRRADEAGLAVRWELVDPLAGEPWPIGVVDAALCVHCLGWGSDADQRRLFRRLRRQVVDEGLLITGGTPFWLAQNAASRDGVRAGSVDYRLETEYDPPSGRTRGTLRVSTAGGQERLLRHDVRLYSTVELATIVREAGFHVVSTDGGRLVARALVAPPRSLAVTSWRTPATERLDLRYAPDEAELLDPPPREIWESLVLSAPDAGADIVGGYAVDDPYGGERGAVVVGGYFGWVVASHQLTFAAGVTSLLHDLSGLADGGPILAPALVHGDLEAWAVSRGNEVRLVPEPATLDELADELAVARPALLHLDRPTFAGGLLELDDLGALVGAAAAVAAVVVIDESALPYLGGSASAATLVPRVDNLVVLRGFTKAYSLGGLRAGYALASEGVAARVRELVAPLQVGELAFHAALRLLAAGDIFARLRARVAAVKPEVVELLEQAGLEVFPGHAAFPWVGVSDPGGAASRLLDHHRIRALRPTPPPAFPAAAGEVLRLTIPLADERRERFRRLLRGTEARRDGNGAVDEPSFEPNLC